MYPLALLRPSFNNCFVHIHLLLLLLLLEPLLQKSLPLPQNLFVPLLLQKFLLLLRFLLALACFLLRPLLLLSVQLPLYAFPFHLLLLL